MTEPIDPKLFHLVSSTVRCLAMDAVQKADSGHPGAPMGLADIGVTLFARFLKFDPKDPIWMGRDRFVLSAGHASTLLYSLLHLAGYDVSLDDLRNFRQWGSRTPGHPEWGHLPGVETTTGPLGQGLGNAVGMALAIRMKQARFGLPFENSRVFVIASDGDIMEGISAETCSLAGHLGLGNLVVLYDDNRITIEGTTDVAFSEDVGKRYEAMGWHVEHVDGHDHGALVRALDRAVEERERPSILVCRTHIAHGAPTAHDTPESHGAPLGEREIAATKVALGFPPDETFRVPVEVTAFFARRREELATTRAEYEARLDTFRTEAPDVWARLLEIESRAVPKDLYATLRAKLPTKDDATRSLSGTLGNLVAGLVPSLIGGSADLGPSTKTTLKDAGSVARGHFSGRNLHFGIREHAMGAICNGIALSGGFIPFGSTFLVFSDYMRGAIRLSALMGLRTLWIFTHDSIFVGEDGPTHQPIEHLWALRTIPGLSVVRPADALECAAAWSFALTHDGPTAFSLTRQKLPALTRPEGFDPEDVLRGGYILREAAGGSPTVVLIATGSEVHLAVGASAALEALGHRVRVVSMPCLEQFESCDAAYRQRVLPDGPTRVVIEAGITAPWRGYAGPSGLVLGIDRYGASAPDRILAEQFGFTVERVTKAIQHHLATR